MKSKGCRRSGSKIYFTLKIMEKSLHFTVKVFKSCLLMDLVPFFRGAVSKYIYLSNTRISPTEQNVTTILEICLINAWQNSREVSPLKWIFPEASGAQLLVSRDLPPTSENLSSSNNCRNWAPTFRNSGVESAWGHPSDTFLFIQHHS